MSDIIIDLQYLPNIDFFTALGSADNIYLDIESPYEKQSYRNRTCILGANKVEQLSVPILHNCGKKVSLKYVRIDYSQKWKNTHLRSLQTAYGKSPFFEFYFDYFLKVYNSKFETLLDLNYNLLTLCLKLLGWKKKIILSDHKFKNQEDKKLLDLRNLIHPKKRAYHQDIITCFPYRQMFGSKFVANLSIIDLLFNEGNNASLYLSKVIRKSGNSEHLNNL